MVYAADPKATPEEARKFINDAEQRLLLLGVDAGRADWVKSTYITDDTEAIAAKLDEKAIAATVAYAKQATRFDGLKLDADTARKLAARHGRAEDLERSGLPRRSHKLTGGPRGPPVSDVLHGGATRGRPMALPSGGRSVAAPALRRYRDRRRPGRS